MYNQFYIQNIQQLIAMGVYNVPVPIRTFPDFLQIPNIQQIPKPSNESIIIDSDSDEDDDVNERTLFCANLHENVSNELLYEIFLQAGPIQKVHIPKDKAGKSRLFGFVTYKYRSCPQYALRIFKGLTMYGRTLNIKFQGKSDFNRTVCRT